MSVGPGIGQGQGGPGPVSLSCPHPSFWVPFLPQGPSGPPGSTGQKVRGLDLEGRAPGRSVGPAHTRREVSEVS